MYVLNANHISKSYKTAGETMRILQNVNLQVMKGEMVAIMGPSGLDKICSASYPKKKCFRVSVPAMKQTW